MADLATIASLLAIVVPVTGSFSQHRLGIGHLPQPVQHAGMAEHAGITQGQAKHGADVVLELRGFCTIAGPVTRIVHARRHLIG